MKLLAEEKKRATRMLNMDQQILLDNEQIDEYLR
jgi:hypothetical protein